MRYASILLLLISAGCSRVPVSHPASIQKAQTYTYWYSQQQRDALDSMVGIDGPKEIQPHYTVRVNGKVLEYTDCTRGTSRPVGRFSDYTKVATVSGETCQPW